MKFIALTSITICACAHAYHYALNQTYIDISVGLTQAPHPARQSPPPWYFSSVKAQVTFLEELSLYTSDNTAHDIINIKPPYSSTSSHFELFQNSIIVIRAKTFYYYHSLFFGADTQFHCLAGYDWKYCIQDKMCHGNFVFIVEIKVFMVESKIANLISREWHTYSPSILI